jgi:hypothetical protein
MERSEIFIGRTKKMFGKLLDAVTASIFNMSVIDSSGGKRKTAKGVGMYTYQRIAAKIAEDDERPQPEVKPMPCSESHMEITRVTPTVALIQFKGVISGAKVEGFIDEVSGAISVVKTKTQQYQAVMSFDEVEGYLRQEEFNRHLASASW